MIRNIKAVWGTSGFGRETMAWLTSAVDGRTHYVFIDDASDLAPLVNGQEAYRFEDFVDLRAESKSVVIAVGDPVSRRHISIRAAHAGLEFFSAIAPSAFVGYGVQIGQGAIIGPQTVVTADAHIGNHVHINILSYVAHDCVVEDYVTVGPGAACNGNVHVHEEAYLGARSVIRQGRPGHPVIIGRGAVVGMGSVVLNSVPPGATVVGNPAKPR